MNLDKMVKDAMKRIKKHIDQSVEKAKAETAQDFEESRKRLFEKSPS